MEVKGFQGQPEVPNWPKAGKLQWLGNLGTPSPDRPANHCARKKEWFWKTLWRRDQGGTVAEEGKGFLRMQPMSTLRKRELLERTLYLGLSRGNWNELEQDKGTRFGIKLVHSYFLWRPPHILYTSDVLRGMKQSFFLYWALSSAYLLLYQWIFATLELVHALELINYYSEFVISWKYTKELKRRKAFIPKGTIIKEMVLRKKKKTEFLISCGEGSII